MQCLVAAVVFVDLEVSGDSFRIRIPVAVSGPGSRR